MRVENISKKGYGGYLPYTVKGTKLTLGKGKNKVTLDLSSMQTDERVVYDVYRDGDGLLIPQELAADTKCLFYAAIISIPPKQTEIVSMETVTDDQGKETTNMVIEKLPLDMEAVSMTLWPLQKEEN